MTKQHDGQVSGREGVLRRTVTAEGARCQVIHSDVATATRTPSRHARFHITATVDNTGSVQERYLYSPYGQRTV
ncbi:hypothetical protein, partial [Ralstonia sp.]|uniref:hypothetical protein n=1 Tax=Ralstonia sp. TaxID=54061 RepID=UPI00397E8507